MRFEEALIELRKGKRIRPEGYFEYLSMEDICKDTLRIKVILFLEWEVEEEPGKTFPEVFEAFKEGKSISRKIWEYPYNKRDPELCYTNDDLLATDWEIIS